MLSQKGGLLYPRYTLFVASHHTIMGQTILYNSHPNHDAHRSLDMQKSDQLINPQPDMPTLG